MCSCLSIFQAAAPLSHFKPKEHIVAKDKASIPNCLTTVGLFFFFFFAILVIFLRVYYISWSIKLNAKLLFYCFLLEYVRQTRCYVKYNGVKKKIKYDRSHHCTSTKSYQAAVFLIFHCPLEWARVKCPALSWIQLHPVKVGAQLL